MCISVHVELQLYVCCLCVCAYIWMFAPPYNQNFLTMYKIHVKIRDAKSEIANKIKRICF